MSLHCLLDGSKAHQFRIQELSPGGPAVEMEADLPSSINCSMQSLINSNSLDRIYLLERALETSPIPFYIWCVCGEGS